MDQNCLDRMPKLFSKHCEPKEAFVFSIETYFSYLPFCHFPFCRSESSFCKCHKNESIGKQIKRQKRANLGREERYSVFVPIERRGSNKQGNKTNNRKSKKNKAVFAASDAGCWAGAVENLGSNEFT